MSNLGFLFLVVPGPIYVHLSWAPRWRMLVMLEEGIEPFTELQLQSATADEYDDSDLEEAVEELELET